MMFRAGGSGGRAALAVVVVLAGCFADAVPFVVQQLEMGTSYACVLSTLGTVKCWGYNVADAPALGTGALGRGDSVTKWGDMPSHMGDNLTKVDFGPGRYAVEILALSNGGSVVARLSDGALVAWGANNNQCKFIGYLPTSQKTFGGAPAHVGANFQRLNFGSHSVTSIAVETFVCVILDAAVLKCWGGLSSGGAYTFNLPGSPGGCAATSIDDIPAINHGTHSNPVQVETTYGISACVLFADGSVKCLGQNSVGQLGMGHTTDWNPSNAALTWGDAWPKVQLPTGRRAVRLVKGGPCAVLDGGDVVCWGPVANSRLGWFIASTNPNVGDQAFEMGNNLTKIAWGDENVKIQLRSDTGCALTAGDMRCWGNYAATAGSNGGSFTATNPRNKVKMDFGTGRTVRLMGTSGPWACAVLDNDQVKCFGDNLNARMGSGTTTSDCKSKAPSTCSAINLGSDSAPILVATTTTTTTGTTSSTPTATTTASSTPTTTSTTPTSTPTTSSTPTATTTESSTPTTTSTTATPCPTASQCVTVPREKARRMGAQMCPP